MTRRRHREREQQANNQQMTCSGATTRARAHTHTHTHLALGELGAHGGDGLLVGLLGAGGLENGAAGHEHVHASLGDGADVGYGHAAVDLKADVIARLRGGGREGERDVRDSRRMS